MSSKLAYVTIARMEKETNNQIKQLVEDKNYIVTTNNIVASFTIIIIATILTGTPSSSTLL